LLRGISEVVLADLRELPGRERTDESRRASLADFGPSKGAPWRGKAGFFDDPAARDIT
jgi:hypothetical protein